MNERKEIFKEAELLSPCGDLDSLYTAVNCGANAVYLGLPSFSARANAVNFSIGQLQEGVQYAHFHGTKVYLAVNTLISDSQITDVVLSCKSAYCVGVDAFILQDIHLAGFLKNLFPKVEYHLSTQGGVCNEQGAIVAKQMGFDRVIVARETSLCDIEKIAKIIDCEVFVQGALCTAFSGACLFSSFVGANSGNRGQCKQPCRKKYTFCGEQCYALSTKDLCIGKDIEQLAKIGVKSFKIEGRMRSAQYVGAATLFYNCLMCGNFADNFQDALARSFNRGFTKGLSLGEKNILSTSSPSHRGVALGKIKTLQKGVATVETTEKLCVKDGFKVLREGVEVGTAIYSTSLQHGVQLKIKGEVRVGDWVHLTKDSKLDKILEQTKKISTDVFVRFSTEDYPFARATFCIDNRQFAVEVVADIKTQNALNSPLTDEEVRQCFSKVSLPFSPIVNVCIEGNLFYQKSALNAFRRHLYESLAEQVLKARGFEQKTVCEQKIEQCCLALSSIGKICASGDITDNLDQSNHASQINKSQANEPSQINSIETTYEDSLSQQGNKGKIALISRNFEQIDKAFDIAVYFPENYADESQAKKNAQALDGKEKYIYIPPYFSSNDILLLSKYIDLFDGIYCDNYCGYALAKQLGKRLFLGISCNIYNGIDASYALQNADYFVLSPELPSKQAPLCVEKAFSYFSGDLPLMHIIHCPYKAKCVDCKAPNISTLTSQEGRKFVLMRYKASSCRFVLFNCDKLLHIRGGNMLINATTFDAPQTNKLLANARNKESLKIILGKYTNGYK